MDLGSGVAFVVGCESGRLLRSGRVEQRLGWAIASEHGRVVHMIASLDVDEARAAGGRLAEERCQNSEV